MKRLISGSRVYLIDGNAFNCRKDNFSFFKCGIRGKMTNKLKCVILGTLLGDASVSVFESHGEKRFRMREAHCDKQRDYLFHKAKLLSPYLTAKPKKAVRGPYISWVVQTRTSCDFDFLEMCCNKKNKKYVSQEWVDNLTLVSLAYWYMDDGFLERGRYVNFSTQSFSAPECNRLVNKLKDMGFNAWTAPRRVTWRGTKRKYLIIRMDYWSSRKFLKKIDHLIVKCMKYKTRIVDAFKETKCDFCGNDMLLRGRRLSSTRKSCPKKECRASRSSACYREKKKLGTG